MGRRPLVVAAESQYANVARQIGGNEVRVRSVLRDPNTDPRTFETSPTLAQEVASAAVVVQNGLGYDAFMDTIENGSPDPARRVIVAARVLGRPANTANPHLWYDPSTMPAVARVLSRDLCRLEPAHCGAFHRRLRRFLGSMGSWRRAISTLRERSRGAPVAVTEPVADYLLTAAGLVDRTPSSFQDDVMNGIDPAPQDLATMEELLAHRKVDAFVYNSQVTDSVTDSLKALAIGHGIPVVGVGEIMPPRISTYQRWMTEQTRALGVAIARGGQGRV